MRRKFFDATLGIKTPTRAHWVIGQISKLAAIEKTVKTLPLRQRHYYRRRHAKSITKSLYRWIQNNASAVSAGSILARALHYMSNNWLALTRYVTQDYLCLINNAAELTMRPVAIGRKNYMSVGSERGGEAAAIFYSLIQTSKNYQINVQEYLTFVLTNLPTTAKGNIDQLMPDRSREKVIS